MDFAVRMIFKFRLQVMEQWAQLRGVKTTHSAFLRALPGPFLTKEQKASDFFEIVVFGSHPVHRYKMLFGELCIEVGAQFDDVQNFVNKIQRARHQAELMPCGDGKSIGVL